MKLEKLQYNVRATTKTTLTTLLLLISSTILWSQSITLTSQIAVDTFDQSLTSITGNLLIKGNDIVDLSNLSNITSISGYLSIGENEILPNLDDLINLTFVGDFLSISQNTIITNLDGLGNINSVGGFINIYNNDALLNLDGLSNIKTNIENLNISRNAVLNNCNGLWNITSITEFLYVRDNPAIININGLSNIKSIGGHFFIDFNDALIELDGIVNLTTIGGDVRINDNKSLKNIDGLSKTTSIGGKLWIYNNELITNLDGLSNLAIMRGSLYINNNPNLTNINGLSKLTSLDEKLTISNNKSLTNLDGLANLTSIEGYLNIKYNASLLNIDGLSKITYIAGIIWIFDNAALTNLDGLFNLTSTNRSMSIYNNPSLLNVDGLSNITFIGGDFEISDNPVLSNLDGLSKLTYVNGELYILTNSLLTNCCGIKNFLSTPGTIMENVHIAQNPSECSSEEDILYSNCINRAISGIVFFDVNQNKTQDKNEFGIPNIPLRSDIRELILTNINGFFYDSRYSNKVYQIMLKDHPMWELTTDYTIYSGIFEPGDSTNDQKNFGLFPNFDQHTVTGNLVSNPPRCNSEVEFFMNIHNSGTNIENGKVQLHYDHETDFTSAIPYPDDVDIINHILYWNIDSLYPFANEGFNIFLRMPNENNTGKTLNFLMDIYLDSLETTLLKNSFEYAPLVLCSFDPNDKLVNPVGVQEDNYTLRNETLLYTIRFQNTGNAEAIDIRIIDTLDIHFDLRTFRVVQSSFPVLTTIDGRIVNFFYNDIFLSDSTTNEPASHGFVSFEVKLKVESPDYTSVENTGHIIFDYNPPITTNTVRNTMVQIIPIEDSANNIPPIFIVPNPAINNIEVIRTRKIKLGKINIYNLFGDKVIQSSTTRIDISNLPSGVYFLSTILDEIEVTEKFVKE